MNELITRAFREEKQAIEEKINTATILDLEVKISNLKDILNNPQSLLNFNMEDIKDYITEFEHDNLEYLKQALGLEFFLITDNELERIKNIISSVLEKIEKIYQEQKQEIDKLHKEIKKLENLEESVREIYNGSYISSEDLRILVEILNKYIDISEVNKLIGELCTLSIINISKVDELELEEIPDEELEIAQETNIDSNLVEALFSSYGYNIDLIKEETRNLLYRYGTLENMDAIFKLLEDNNIFVNIKRFQKQFCNILIHSNKENVSTIIELLKRDMIVNESSETLNEVFENVLCAQEIFINRKRAFRRYKKSGGSSGGGQNNGGRYENFVINHDYLESLGANVLKIIDSCEEVMRMNPNRLKRCVRDFDFYGIPKESYLNSPSAFKATTNLETMDMFIELGGYEYACSNPSMLVRATNSPMFYRLYKAKEENEQVFRKTKKSILLPKRITVESEKGYGIDFTNGSEVVKQYIPEFSTDYGLLIEKDTFDYNMTNALNDELIKFLEENYKIDDLRYNFNGVIISRNKVLRNYELLIRHGQGGKFEALMYALTKNSILNEEEFNLVFDCAKKVLEKRGR